MSRPKLGMTPPEVRDHFRAEVAKRDGMDRDRWSFEALAYFTDNPEFRTTQAQRMACIAGLKLGRLEGIL